MIEPDILLETNAQGVGNWQFESMAAKADTAEDGAGDGAMPHIGRLLIENGRLTYRDGVSGETTKIMLTSLEADAASPSDPLNLKLQAAFNDMALTLHGSVGPLKNALSPDQALQIDLTASGLGLTVKIKGSAKAASGVLDARVDVAAADLSGLRALAGDGVPANVALKLSAQAKTAAGKASLSDLVLTLGKSDLAGSASIDTTGKLPKIMADLKGNRLDLSELLPPADKGATEKSPKSGKPGRPGKVLPADPLPLDGLKAAEAQIKIAIGEVVAPQITLNEVSATIKLSEGRLSLEPLKANVAGSPVTISASVDAGGKVPTVALNVSAPKLDLGRLLRETKITDLLRGTGNLTIKLTGKGASLAAIAGSLNGGTKFFSEPRQDQERGPGFGHWRPFRHCRHDVVGKIGMDGAELYRLALRLQKRRRDLKGAAGGHRIFHGGRRRQHGSGQGDPGHEDLAAIKVGHIEPCGAHQDRRHFRGTHLPAGRTGHGAAPGRPFGRDAVSTRRIAGLGGPGQRRG
ncbi:MAG: AsmA family protein [Alphaproteobacteria bacterium]